LNKTMKNRIAVLVFMAPALIIFTYIIFFSIIRSFNYSLFEWDGINQATYVGLSNYQHLLTDPASNFWVSIKNTMAIALFSIFIQLPIALILALVLRAGIKGEKIYRTVFFIPVIISSVVIGQLWLKIYHPNYGLLNSLLEMAGFENLTKVWLGDTETALLSVIAPAIWQYIGYHMLLFYTAAKSIPEELYDAAKVDGASNFRTAISITIPQLKPIFKACVIFAVIGSFKAFDMIYLLTAGGPNKITEVPSIIMYKSIFTRYSYGYGSAVAIIIVLECLLATVLIQKLFAERKS